MGATQSRFTITAGVYSQVDEISFRNIAKISRKMMPAEWGRLTFELDPYPWSSGIWVWVRLSDGRKRSIMYSKQKDNGNFEIFQQRVDHDNPIGYIKRQHDAKYKTYRFYAKKKYLGEITIQRGVTKIKLPIENQRAFISKSPVIGPSGELESLVIPDACGKTVWALYDLGEGGEGLFRLDTRSPFSWMQAFACAVVVMRT